MTLEVGQPAPDFTLPLGRGGNISLSNMRGKPVVLYFYPKDDTPGCTTQACNFRDKLPEFGNLDTAVIGISRDDVASHLAFAKKYDLYFHLAADETGQVSAAYDVWKDKNNYGKTYQGIERTTFLIDEKGIVRAIWRKVSVEGHIAEILKAVEALRLNMPYNYPGAKPPPPPEPEPKPAPAPKAVAKPKAAPAKPAAKPDVKPVAKKVEEKKPVAKAAAKPAAKPVVAKAAPKKVAAKKAAPAKKTVKAAVKPVAKKAAKPVAKKAAPVAKRAVKPVAKKTTAKVVKKAPVKKAAVKKVTKPAAKKKR